ncbi:MAG: hypothetical protein KA004_13130 [Verrucomicrobiales bacterium]|nr:hypothetical protein [Verrucomicrobiales bacterium]
MIYIAHTSIVNRHFCFPQDIFAKPQGNLPHLRDFSTFCRNGGGKTHSVPAAQSKFLLGDAVGSR